MELTPQQEVEFNDLIERWARDTESLLKANAPSKTGKTRRKIKAKVRYESGVAFAVRFPVTRYGIFVDLGVGRGRPKGSGKGKGWFFPVLVSQTELLSKQIAEFIGNKYIDNLRIAGPSGVANFKV